MNELILAHLTECVMDVELRLFMRTLYRIGVLAKVDLVNLFLGGDGGGVQVEFFD